MLLKCSLSLELSSISLFHVSLFQYYFFKYVNLARIFVSDLAFGYGTIKCNEV